MDALIDLAMRLAEISDRDLQTLRTTIDAVPNTAPGLMVWLEHAVNCESDQRAGRVYPLLGPMSAIPDEELAQSIAAAEVLAAKFRGDAISNHPTTRTGNNRFTSGVSVRNIERGEHDANGHPALQTWPNLESGGLMPPPSRALSRNDRRKKLVHGLRDFAP